jgi:hypothetical protein
MALNAKVCLGDISTDDRSDRSTDNNSDGSTHFIPDNSSAHYGYPISTGVSTDNFADCSPHVFTERQRRQGAHEEILDTTISSLCRRSLQRQHRHQRRQGRLQHRGTNAVADIVADNSPTSLPTPPPTTDDAATHSDVDTNAVADTVADN